MRVVPGYYFFRFPPSSWAELTEGHEYFVRVRAMGTNQGASVTLETEALAELSPNTPAGSEVEPSLPLDVRVSFSEIADDGYTSVAFADNPPDLPDGLLAEGAVYEIHTTAVHNENEITITLLYDPDRGAPIHQCYA